MIFQRQNGVGDYEIYNNLYGEIPVRLYCLFFVQKTAIWNDKVNRQNLSFGYCEVLLSFKNHLWDILYSFSPGQSEAPPASDAWAPGVRAAAGVDPEEIPEKAPVAPGIQ